MNLFTDAGVWCRTCLTFRCLVVQSRHAKEGILRRRRCVKCGKTYRTIEVFYSDKNGDVCDDYPAVEPRSTWVGRGHVKR